MFHIKDYRIFGEWERFRGKFWLLGLNFSLGNLTQFSLLKDIQITDIQYTIYPSFVPELKLNAAELDLTVTFLLSWGF